MKICVVLLLCLFISIESGEGNDRNVEIELISYKKLEKQHLNIEIYLDVSKKEIDINKRLQYLTIKEFKNVLGYYESKHNYQIVNKLGFKGKYQFSNYMINRFANVEPQQFLNNPIIQEESMNKVCNHYISYIIDHKYDRYINKKIDGVTITMEGLMLGLHFCPLWLKQWLQSNGKINPSDSFPGYKGITIRDYIKRFEKEEVVKNKYRIEYCSSPG